MFRSRPLQVLLLLACGVPAVAANPPAAAFGAGMTTCESYVQGVKGPSADAKMRTIMVTSWVEGYFSARNVAGHLRPGEKKLTVGGSISADTLQAMLVDQCSSDERLQSLPVLFAVEGLYEKLQQKGL